MQITIHDFSGVYSEQPFLQTLRDSSHNVASASDNVGSVTAEKKTKKIKWLDCTQISGTDCYCDNDAVAVIREQIAKAGIENAEGIHFFDNGNYHYMSKIWTDMIQEPFTLVVFDHHPDMQPPRFGDILSCGGWVKKALDENKFIDNVIIIGVADHLVDEIREEIASHPSGARNDNHQNKVTFIRESEIANIQTNSLLTAHSSQPLYISIDKDALSHADAATNWDQGSLSLEHMKAIITEIAKDRRIIGVDICGERARDFAGDEHHSIQEADAQNDRTNRELVEFFRNLLIPSHG
ncbi:MAG: arginase family protein [Fibrobacter sp.]|uniref:arginase family protein n=1 Tax=Fibrobacter sp. TaxID=35828 RepID=UPI0025BF1C55|nr:arginase family protein [Fibrobacter sp.]MBQ3715180.1 arginase family protein [Fibrobacter sp.]MBQ7080055.1 arginase family protein [Fibrobacter sp.]